MISLQPEFGEDEIALQVEHEALKSISGQINFKLSKRSQQMLAALLLKSM